MLTNVLGDAVKYSPDVADIAITDHGIGMTPAQVGRVCERFYRADTSGNIPGTSLGMAIVKETIELLGGQLEIASSPGLGTTVTLWLPADGERSGR